MVMKESNMFSLNTFMRDWVSCISTYPQKNRNIGGEWNPPMDGGIKPNFDGSSMENPGPSGFGCIARDANGKVLFVKCNPLGFKNSNEAKLLSLLHGMRMLKARELYGCHVEGDSKIVVSWAKRLVVNLWQWNHYIKEVRGLLKDLQGEINHIPRAQNMETDRLAKWGVGVFVGENMSELFKGCDGLYVVFVVACFIVFPCFSLLLIQFDSLIVIHQKTKIDVVMP